jgi:hypothetical protein
MNETKPGGKKEQRKVYWKKGYYKGQIKDKKERRNETKERTK